MKNKAAHVKVVVTAVSAGDLALPPLNKLLEEIKLTPIQNQFKTKLQRFLVSKSQESVDESLMDFNY